MILFPSRFSKSYLIARAFLVASLNGIIDEQDLKDVSIDCDIYSGQVEIDLCSNQFQSFKQEYHDKLNFMGHTIAIAEAEAKSRSLWLKENLVEVQGWLENYTKRS